MRKTIDRNALKTLRERAGWSQNDLAARAKISKDSLSRLERGKQSGAAKQTQTKLAKALAVEVEFLTGEKELSPSLGQASPQTWEAPRDQWNIRVDSAVRNAFALTAIRYQIPIPRIIELAPLLFVLIAEQSLARRRERLANLGEALDRVTEAAEGFNHLPRCINPGFEAHEAMAEEEASIKALDILAEKINNNIFDLFGPQKDDYEPADDNPFVSYLKEMASVVTKPPEIISVTSFSREEVDYKVCGREAYDLADGNKELAKGILSGWAPLHEARDLLEPNKKDDRIAWLNQKKAEYEAASARLLEELGFSDLQPRGDAL